MIKLFRKIRHKLLIESKLRKYFLYAIGEIILVVIGILIALHINNLNDQRKIGNTIQTYYNQLLQDFENDKKYIESTIASIDSSAIELESYRRVFDKPNLSTNEIFSSFKLIEWSVTQIQFQSNTINTLERTGDFNLIPLTIRNKLLDYKRKQEITTKVSEGNNQRFVDQADFATTRYFGSSNFMIRSSNQPDLSKYINDKERSIKSIIALESAIQSKEDSERNTLKSFKQLLQKIEEITKLIKNELVK